MNINTFLYYMNFYHDQVNGDGTFTHDELIQEFKCNENEEKTNKLIVEADFLSKELDLEDWKMDSTIVNLCNKYSKKHLKRIIKIILEMK